MFVTAFSKVGLGFLLLGACLLMFALIRAFVEWVREMIRAIREVRAASKDTLRSFDEDLADVPAPLVERLRRIERKVRHARWLGRTPFGGEGNGLEFGTPADSHRITAFEHDYGIELPAEYRAFITTLGNGAGGPAYGLKSLEDALVDIEGRVTSERLRTPFAYIEFDNARELYDPTTDNYTPLVGAIRLCGEGCGIEHILVITGATRG